MAFDTMAAIYLDFKWFDFWISDTIRNPNHLRTYLFLTIWNLDQSGFQFPTVQDTKMSEFRMFR